MNAEERDSLENQLSQAASEMDLWRSLQKHPGWELFKGRLLQHMQIRSTVVMTTPLNVDSNVYAQEFLKGEFSGLQTAIDFPQSQFDERKREATLLRAQLENYDDAEIAARPAKSRVDTDDNFGE